MNIYDKILDQCCSTDERRPGLCKPATQKRHTYASDGLIMVRVPWNLPTICYVPHIKAPDFESVLPTPDLSVPISFSDLREALDMVPQVPTYEDCSQCKGSGEIECKSCGHVSACAYCGGDGNGEQNGEGPDMEYSISFLPGAFVRADLVLKLYRICSSTESEPILRAGGATTMHLFDVGPIQIVLAPNKAEEHMIITLPEKRVFTRLQLIDHKI